MAVKTKLEIQDQDSSLVDIPLFATVEDAVKDIQLEESMIKIQIVEEDKQEKQ